MSALTVYANFVSAVYEDGLLVISMTPEEPVGGWTLQTVVTKRFGGTPLVSRYMASGYYGVSGMNIVNSGQGIFSVTLNSSDFSGKDPGNYAFQITRTDSGSRTNLTDGYLMLTW